MPWIMKLFLSAFCVWRVEGLSLRRPIGTLRQGRQTVRTLMVCTRVESRIESELAASFNDYISSLAYRLLGTWTAQATHLFTDLNSFHPDATKSSAQPSSDKVALNTLPIRHLLAQT
ncbi:hypothetical protein BJ508DRAFT_152224 [Ascobolus immersus RN42]|uniref:Secreted protein n=1 Tax=Ascobolus immersus RN42 TaxID=1160509 RepID=A0A3N4HY21_ASCIM|nr:hypothetical protein BJ508DRAFT_152224 [Ascobolus immersus RN42]